MSPKESTRPVTKVTILMLGHGLHSTVTGPLEVFMMAGVAWNHLLGQPLHPRFEVSTVSIDGKAVKGSGGLSITPDGAIRDITQTDLILVSSGGASLESVLRDHAGAIPWLQAWHARGATIAGVCSGVGLLAEAGLLDGKDATTHWGIAEEFRRRFPQVNLIPDRIVTDNGTVLCGGGVNAALDLSLYLVERTCGRETAMQCAKSLLIDASRTSQAGFAVLSFNKHHADRAVMEAQDWIERHHAGDLSVDALASRFNMSPRTFLRRFKAATGSTPLSYLQQVRVAAARQAIEEGSQTIEAIGHRVGYEDIAFFRTVFRRHVGMTPNAYREKFGLLR